MSALCPLSKSNGYVVRGQISDFFRYVYITYLGYTALSIVQAYYVRAGGFGNAGCEFFIRRLKYSIDSE